MARPVGSKRSQSGLGAGLQHDQQLPDLTNRLPGIVEGFVVVQDRIHLDMDEIVGVLLLAAAWGQTTMLLCSVARWLRMIQALMDAPDKARPD